MSERKTDFRVLPEAALVLAAQAGEQRAFTELVRRREGTLRALLRRFCHNASDADDLAQEAFLRAWHQLNKLREPAAFGAWLRQLAVRLFVDARRIKQLPIDDSIGIETLESRVVDPDRVVGAQIDLERALGLLSAAERLCIVLNLGEGLSHREIEDVTALPLGTVKSHILRGTAKLRQVFGRPWRNTE